MLYEIKLEYHWNIIASDLTDLKISMKKKTLTVIFPQMRITAYIVQNLTYSSIMVNLCSSDYPMLTLLKIFPGVF